MEVLKQLRTQRGYSQRQLASRSGIDQGAISEIEAGKRSPSVVTLERLVRAMDAEMAELFPKAQAPLPFEEDSPEQRRSSNAVQQSYSRVIEGWTEHIRSLIRSWDQKLDENYGLSKEDGPPSEPFDRPLYRRQGAELWAIQVREDGFAIFDAIKSLELWEIEELWEADSPARSHVAELHMALHAMNTAVGRVCQKIPSPGDPHWGLLVMPDFILSLLLGHKAKYASTMAVSAETASTKLTNNECEEPEKFIRKLDKEFGELLSKELLSRR